MLVRVVIFCDEVPYWSGRKRWGEGERGIDREREREREGGRGERRRKREREIERKVYVGRKLENDNYTTISNNIVIWYKYIHLHKASLVSFHLYLCTHII